MIIFLNGSFGVGKTTVAERLIARIPNSLLFDAEEVGFFLRKVLAPIDQPDDFQHYSLWRSLVVTTAKELLKTYERTLIMPMTIWHTPYFEEVIGGLRDADPDFHHFCLTAPITVIRERLEQRGDGPDAWNGERIQLCFDAFQSSIFEKKIATEKTSVENITDVIFHNIYYAICA